MRVSLSEALIANRGFVVAFAVVWAAAASASAQKPGDRTDNDAPIRSGGAIPLPGTEGAPPACPFTIQGTLGSGSPEWPSVSGTQNGRLTLDGVASTCAVPGGCVIFTAVGARAFDAYTFVDGTGVTRCVNVGLTMTSATICDPVGVTSLWVVGYLNNHDPTAMCTNWLADTGSSFIGNPVGFTANVPAGGSLILAVQDSIPCVGAGDQYNLTMSGECVPVELHDFTVE